MSVAAAQRPTPPSLAHLAAYAPKSAELGQFWNSPSTIGLGTQVTSGSTLPVTCYNATDLLATT